MDDQINKIPVSVPILTLNSEKYLGRCLDSVKNVSELIVMDGNSVDKTREIASSFGAKIYKQFDSDLPNQRIENFTEMRLKLWSKATQSWMLILDSDEFATSELIKEIKEVIARSDKNTAFEIPRLQIIEGKRIIKHSFSYPYNYLRLFHKESGVSLKEKSVHEQMYVPENVEVKLLKNFLLTDLPHPKEDVEKDRHYLNLTLKGAESFSWGKIINKMYKNFKKAFGIALKSGLIYLKHGFKESLPPRYVWRFVDYHLKITTGLLKKKINKDFKY